MKKLIAGSAFISILGLTCGALFAKSGAPGIADSVAESAAPFMGQAEAVASAKGPAGSLPAFAKSAAPQAGSLPVPTSAPSTTPPIAANSGRPQTHRDLVLDPQRSVEVRYAELLRLTAEGESALLDLAQIAVAPIVQDLRALNPHSVQRGALMAERGLRLEALEALDKLASVQPEKVLQLTETVLEKQNDPQVRRWAQVLIMGLHQRRPGKLTRLVDLSLAQFAKQTGD